MAASFDQTTLSPSRPVDATVDERDEEGDRDPPEADILKGWKLFLAFVAMLNSMFLVALDGVSVIFLCLLSISHGWQFTDDCRDCCPGHC